MDLGWIRHRLDTLAAGRRAPALGAEEAALYRELCALELRLLARGPG